MDDVEYILRIILKARDDMAAVLAKSRTQLRAFAKDADKMNEAVTNLNQAMKNFDTNMEGVTKKLESWRAILRDAGGESKTVAKSIDDIGKSADKATKATKQNIESQKQLQDRARGLRQEVKAITEARNKEAISAKFAASEYERLGKQLEAVSLKMSDAARTRTPANDWALQARESADQIKQIDKEITDDAKAESKKREQNAQEAERVRLNNVKRHNKEVEQEILAQIDRQEEAEKRRVERIKASNDLIGKYIEQQIKDELAASKDAAKDRQRILADAEKQRVSITKLANAQIAREIEQQIKDDEQAAKERYDNNLRWETLQAKARERMRQAERLRQQSKRVDDDTDPSEIRRLSAEYTKLANSYRAGSGRAREFGREAEQLRTVLRRTTTEVKATDSAFSRLSKSLKSSGDGVAGFDNQVRGMGLLLAVASAQQLISTVIALGGELVSLAGSAAMAGGALGGILAAGAAQALPVIGLLAGAFQRVTSVIDAAQQAQKLQQAQFTDAEKGGQKAIDQANTLANANDTVTAANDRLADSRKDLTTAQKEGVDQLEDLITAERQAGLAARGAALDVKSAQEALRLAVSSGASQLEIDQKRLAVDEAKSSRASTRVTARRATSERRAAGGDVGNLESVKQAAKSVEEAEKAVTRANRGLDQAEDKTTRAASSTMTAAANLDFLLSQLSPAERRLYEAGTSLYESYKKIFQGSGTGGSGIYGVIIDAFTRAVEKVEKIMEMPKVINGIQGLANVIGKNIDKVVDAVDPAVIEQLLTIIGNAGDNMGPLVDMAIKLAKAFLNISETANPAFQKLLEYLGPIVDKFLALTSDKDKMEGFFLSGEDHLESWLDLVQAIIGLFAVLVGASADSGKKSIDDLTEKINGWTDSLEENGDKVKKFFDDAREAAYAVGGVLENLAVTLFGSFDAERVEHFADILNKAVIPAIAEVIDIFGEVTDKIAEFIDTPAGAEIAKWVIVFALFSKISFGLVGIFSKLFGTIERFGKVFGGIRTFVGFLATKAPIIETIVKLLARIGIRAIPFVGWAAAIALVLDQFGLLDDAWEEIKEAGKALWGQIEPPLKRFMESFKRLVDVVKEGEGAFGPLTDALRWLLKILVEVGGFILEGIAKAIGQVIGGIIDVIGGLIDVVVGLLTGDFKLAWEGVKDIVLGVLNAVIGIVQLVFFRGLGRAIKLGFDGLKWIGKTLLDLFWSGLKELPGLFGKALELGWNVLKNLPRQLFELAKDAVSFWWRGWKLIGKTIRDGIEAAWGFLKKLPGRYWELAKDVVSFFWRGYKRLGQIIRDGIEIAWDFVKKLPGRYWELAKDVVRRFWNGYKTIGKLLIQGISEAWEWIKKLPDRMASIAKKTVEAFANAFKGLGDLIAKAISGGVKGAGNLAKTVVNSIFRFIEDTWNKTFGGREFGRGPLKFKIPELHLPKLAAGGPVPGTGSGDSVPALLEPGEHVLTKREVAAAGGHSVIFAIRKLLGGGGQSLGGRFQAGGAAFDPVRGTFHGAASAYDPLTSIDYEAARKRANEARKKEADERKKDLTTQRKDYKKSSDERAEDNRTMWRDMLTTTRRATNDIEKQVRDMRVNTDKSIDRMSRDILKVWIDTWHSMEQVTHEGLFYIGHETNKALTSLGEKHIDFHLTAPTKHDAEGKQRGGMISGSGDGDKVHVLAEPGEGFINKRAVKALGGAGAIDAINRLIPRFQAGGMVAIPGQPGETIHKSILGDVMKLIKTYKLKIYDGYAATGHAAGGEHPKGLAIDAGPGLGGSWDLVDKLARWAEPSQNNPRSPFRWVGYTGDANHGRNDHIHLSWIAGKTITGLADFATQVMKRMVTGPDGGFKTLLNASIEGVRKVANKFIDAKASAFTGESAEDIKVGKIGPGAANIFKFFRGHGFSDEQAAAWVGNFTQESNLNPSAIQPNGEGHGLAQWGGGRFAALVEFAKSHNKPWQDMGTQLAFVMHELSGSESAAYRVIKAAKTVEDATNAIGTTYERYGIQGDRSGPARAVFHKFSGKFDEGGVVDGPEGAPTHILAHAGEWVLNKGQQLRAAMLSGLSISGLRSMLGFHGKGGEWGYAGGTEVRKRQLKATGKIVSERSDDLSDDLMQSVGESLSDLRGLARAITKVKNITRSVRPIIDLIELATKDDGFLDRLRGSIESQFARAALRLRRSQYKVDERTGKVTRELSDVQVARRARNDARGQRDELKDERRVIQGELGTVSDKLALTGKRRVVGDARRKLQAQEIVLNNRLAEAQGRIVQNTEDIFNAQEELARAQEAAAEKRKENFQKSVDKVKESFTRSGAGIERAKRIAAALGSPKLVEEANKATEDNLNDNREKLSKKLKAAKKSGFKDIAAELAEDIAELDTQIVELAQQRLRDAVDAIGTAASRRTAVLDLFGRMADAVGTVGQNIATAIPGAAGVGTLGAQSRAQVAQGRIDSARQEQAGYIRELANARAARNEGLSQELTDKINELTVVIAENTKAAFDARVQDVSTRHDYTNSMIDLELQLVDLDGSITGQVDTTKKQNLLAQRGVDLAAKGNELSLLLAEATPGTQTYLDLQKAVKENEVATKQNTVALNELSGAGSAPVSFTSLAWQWFNTAFLTGTGGIMPQYGLPLMSNLAGGSTGDNVVSTSSNQGGDTNIDIEINEAGQPIDVTQIASTIVFSQSTAH